MKARTFVFLALVFAAVFGAREASLAQSAKSLAVKPKMGPLQGTTVYTNSHAILIGVGRYSRLPKSRWLEYAERDATELRNVLISSYGFLPENIKVLLNEQATKKAIEDALTAAADDKTIKKDDRILFFFSGHGQTVKAPNGGDMGFLIPHDGDVDLSNPGDSAPYLKTCVKMDGVWTYLTASPAKHSLLLVDACYGGLLAKSRGVGEKPSSAVIAQYANRPAMQVLTAGGKDEEAFEDPKLGHGAFTFKLLEELRARASQPDHVFITSELGSALKVSVGNVTGGKQTPQFGNYGNTEGEFLFVSTDPSKIKGEPLPPAGPQPLTVRKHVKSNAEVVYLPAGSFWMGADRADIDAAWQKFGWMERDKPLPTEVESPKHKVKIKWGFWMDRTEVTVAQYRRYCEDTEREMPEQPLWWDKDENVPVTGVSWSDAQAYCKWAGGRLPTEAEWEYAARAGRTGFDAASPEKCDESKRTLFFWGNEFPAQAVANIGDETAANTEKRPKQVFRPAFPGYNDGFDFASPVARFPANPFKLFDMDGNVMEWCSDYYSATYYRRSKPVDPQGPQEVTASLDLPARRIMRGGSWFDIDPTELRITQRRKMDPAEKSVIVGFRVVFDYLAP